jgi:hypothetical protein
VLLYGLLLAVFSFVLGSHFLVASVLALDSKVLPQQTYRLTFSGSIAKALCNIKPLPPLPIGP